MKTIVLSLTLLFFFGIPAFAQQAGNHMLLPENLAYFTASRVRTVVSLQWQTVNEQNSKGFIVQRKTIGAWEQISFLPSNAGGNSSARVSYSYSEINVFKGISQYRVAEVINTGKQKWSEVRAVRSEGQTGRLSLYPNPSMDGRATLVFDNSSPRDITVTDLTGYPVKQFSNTLATTIQLENLEAGWYTVRIIEKATSEVLLEKLIVSQ